MIELEDLTSGCAVFALVRCRRQELSSRRRRWARRLCDRLRNARDNDTAWCTRRTGRGSSASCSRSIAGTSGL